MASEATKTEAFTPGPTSAAPWHQNAKDDVIYNDNGGQVAYVVGTKADGAMIAAAPDLYAACKDVVNCYANLSDDALAQAVSMARAALTKATGGAA